jgi:23S rRNA U2552 (ribose-2'-O)-methylase RlmE/FtsJ
MEESLRDMLKHGRKFERLRITEHGIFIRKIPQSKNEPAYLAVEINPIDESGNPMNKIGIIIRNQNELDAIRTILSQKKVDEVLQAIERVS